MPWGSDPQTSGGWGKDPVAGRKPKGPPVAPDVAKSGLAGVLQGAADILEVVHPVNALARAFPGGPIGQLVVKPLVNAFGAHAPANMAGGDYQPQTAPGRYARTIGEFAPNALIGPAGGGGGVRNALSRAAQAVVPAVASEGAADVTRALGGGEKAQTVARVAGGVVGGMAAGATLQPRAENDRALNIFARRQGATPEEMRARANVYAAAGISPTLVDVTDDAGRGVVRATASRMTPARQATTDFRDSRALDLPSRISGQARRTISADPRTPDQIRAEMTAARSRNADTAYNAVRNERINLAPETAQALRTPLAREAIREAARRERNPDIRAELNRLADAALDNPGGTQITIGMADRIARTLHGRGQAAQGDRDLASFYHSLANDVRGPARTASSGYADAVRGYEADSRLVDAAGAGEGFMARNTDEFVQQVGNMSPEERALAQAAARRAVERKAGENISAAPGVARALADSPEQQARNNALLGPDRATAMQNGMRLEERAVRNANDVAPRIGSQTDLRSADRGAIDAAMNVAGGVREAATGNVFGLAARVVNWWRSRGLSDAEAQRLTEMAIDPKQLPQVLAYIDQRLGPQAKQDFLSSNPQLLALTSGVLATAQ